MNIKRLSRIVVAIDRNRQPQQSVCARDGQRSELIHINARFLPVIDIS
jgi:hypothetical protein